MDRFEWIATAAFGLEGLVARELARLGIEAKAENGGARDCAERGMRMSQALLRARQNGEVEEAAPF